MKQCSKDGAGMSLLHLGSSVVKHFNALQSKEFGASISALEKFTNQGDFALDFLIPSTYCYNANDRLS